MLKASQVYPILETEFNVRVMKLKRMFLVALRVVAGFIGELTRRRVMSSLVVLPKIDIMRVGFPRAVVRITDGV